MTDTESALIGVFAFVVALFVSLAIKVADQWERVVILRLGKFRSLKGPGLFLIIPIDEYALRRFEEKLNDRISTEFGGEYRAALHHSWINGANNGYLSG